MIEELSNLSKELLQVMPRRSLEELAWQEKEIIEQLKAELLSATESNQDLKNNAEKIEELLARLKRMLFERSSEKSERIDNKNHSTGNGKGNRAPSRKLPSERYPNLEVVEVEISLKQPPQCTCCGSQLSDSGLRECSEQLTVVPRRYEILRIYRPKLHCTTCHSGLVVCPEPRIRPGSSFSDDMIIDVAASKYGDLIPIERYCEIAASQGVEGLPPHSLIELTHYLSDFLLVVVGLIRKALLSSEVLHADETPHRMLEGDEKSNWYLWGFCDGRNSYFEIHDTRSGDVASQLLADSSCHTLISDVFSGYERAVRIANEGRDASRKIQNAFCNSHARRRFTEALENFPEEAKFYLEQYREIYRLEAERKTLPYDKQLDCRTRMSPYFEKMREQGQKDLANVSSKSSLARAIKYFEENYVGLTRCLHDVKIPLDNNLQERQLRRPVVGRKTWYGTHSKRGAQTAANLFTIAQSCRLCKVNMRKYLQAVVQALHAQDPPFTPWEYSVQKSASHGGTLN